MHGTTEAMSKLEERLHRFGRHELLREALTHRSWVNEHASERELDNERLEFLGDAVLGLAVSQVLMKLAPRASEGELTRMRAAIVNEGALAQVGERLGVGPALRLGRGEDQLGGRARPSLLANAVEACIGAVYLDAGLEAVLAIVGREMGEAVTTAAAGEPADPKSQLQEIAQDRWRMAPRYALVSESGPDHEKEFEVEIFIDARSFGRGRGRNKKAAEQQAAREALRRLGEGS